MKNLLLFLEVLEIEMMVMLEEKMQYKEVDINL